MTNENQHNDVAQQTGAAQPPLAAAEDAGLGVRGASRRRFARVGAGASGVLMTLVSQQGMACAFCRAPSGYQSIKDNPSAAVSKPVNSKLACEGWTPTRWHNLCSSSSTPWAATLFNTGFDCKTGNATIVAIGSKSAQYLVGLSNPTSATAANAKNQAYILAMWLTAAYLNVAYKKSEFLTVEHLQGIWNGYKKNGTYTPTAAVKPWDWNDMIIYLSGTMD